MAEREVVVVTGATGGVGRAVAQEFARHGAAVGLIARGREGLDAAATEVSELGEFRYAHRADVADFHAVSAAAAAIEERVVPIDVWINNAMTKAEAHSRHQSIVSSSNSSSARASGSCGGSASTCSGPQ